MTNKLHKLTANIQNKKNNRNSLNQTKKTTKFQKRILKQKNGKKNLRKTDPFFYVRLFVYMFFLNDRSLET